MRNALRVVVAFCLAVVVSMTAFGQGYANRPKITKSDLTKLEKEYKTSKATYQKKGVKSDSKVKKQYTTATYAYGYACMMSDVLDRKEKYKKALGLYNEVLKVDPNHKEAKSQAQLIVDIYKSMGKPVPN